VTVHVINLDRDTERLTKFLTLNAHVPDIVRVSAVDGASLDRKALSDLGIISADLGYDDPNLGCALSHIRLWRKSVSDNRVVTIAEDDAVFAPNFHVAHDLILKGLPADWGLILWGWNFDAEMAAEIIDGVTSAIMRVDQNALRRNIDIFRRSEIAARPFRLHRGFGLLGYSVSPGGARILLENCLPLINVGIPMGDNGPMIRNGSIDSITQSAYRLMKSYICIPPLAVSENWKRGEQA
jgi:GR25 family glycosyltransferase involved in LPS biosynthesis